MAQRPGGARLELFHMDNIIFVPRDLKGERKRVMSRAHMSKLWVQVEIEAGADSELRWDFGG